MSEATTRFLKIEDLAARWELSIPRTKDRVKKLGVPYLNLGNPGARISWLLVRFRLEEIVAFEGGKAETLPESPLDKEQEARRATPPGSRRRPGRPSLLWK